MDKEKVLNYISGDGVIVLIVSILAAIMLFSDLIAEKWPKAEKVFNKLANPKFILIPTIISVICLIVAIVNMNDTYGLAHFSIGFFVIWIGLILTAVYAFLYKKENKTKVSTESDKTNA